MSTTRTFRFSNGSSDKFWSITVDEATTTVVFGRSGTTGQRQDKTFADASAASAAAAKLIAEKQGKGYVEQGAGAAPPAPSQAKATPAAAPAPSAPLAPRQSAEGRRIRLQPDDWRIATWRQLPQPTIPAPRPFDQQACCAVLAKARPGSYGWDWHFDRLGIPLSLTRREATFWMLALKDQGRDTTPTALAEQLAKAEIPEGLDAAQIATICADNPYRLGQFTIVPLRHLLTPAEFVGLCVPRKRQSYGWWPLSQAIPGSLHAWLVPLLDAGEREAYRTALRPHLDQRNWDLGYAQQDLRLFILAARFGMHAELRPIISGLQPGVLPGCLDVVFGLDSADSVLAEARRLQLCPSSAEQAVGWLATTEYAGLAELATAVIAQTDKDRAKDLVEVLALVDAPEAAQHMLQVREKSRAPAVARTWLETHIRDGLAGLAEHIGGNGALAQAALEWAHLVKRQGHLDLITAVADMLPDGPADRLRRHVIAHTEVEFPPFPAGEPAWFAAAAAPGTGKLPGWADPANLPPLTAGKHRLVDAQVLSVLQALRDPQAGEGLLEAVRRNADSQRCDTFVWALFQAWLADGAPSKEKWAMMAMGRLGGDGCVLRLTPLVRAWPGESQHARAVAGLEVLRRIGSDLALSQLNGVAQKLPFKGLKAKAAEFMEAIAKDKGLTRPELEDRIIPDCGLDERGQRSFDFGPRRFSFALGPELKPVLRDAAGKILSTLPKPNGKDDAVLAEQATIAWKILKKLVADAATVQSTRLEQAMVTGRRWKTGDFTRLLVGHPLMFHLVRLLVWSASAPGKPPVLFRITEEREAVDRQDAPIDLSACTEVGIIHPLQMQPAERGAWGQVISDYGIIPPFPQLGRPAHAPTADELAANAFTRCQGIKLPAPTLVFGLEKLGWHRGAAMDAGGFMEHLKPYPSAGCTAIVTYDGTVGMGYIDANESLTVTGCFLVPGLYSAGWYPEHKNRVPLATADPVVVSEVLNDLLQLAAKAK